MEYVMIITRDVNGKRGYHYGSWDDIGRYIPTDDIDEEDEILMITVNGACVYSALTSPAITWDDVRGFFA